MNWASQLNPDHGENHTKKILTTQYPQIRKHPSVSVAMAALSGIIEISLPFQLCMAYWAIFVPDSIRVATIRAFLNDHGIRSTRTTNSAWHPVQNLNHSSMSSVPLRILVFNAI